MTPRPVLAYLSAAAFACLFALLTHGAPMVVEVAREPAQKMVYGMDFERLWSWDTLKPAEKKRLARLAVGECRVQYARVAVRAAAEPADGTFKPEAYDQILDMMRHLKEARPDIQFFGSPRPINAERWKDKQLLPFTCYPMWITKFSRQPRKDKPDRWRYEGFEPDKAAEYMVRYCRFMNSQGFTISFLDLKNEVDRLISPDDARVVAAGIRAQLGAEAPLLIAPSSFDFAGAQSWLRQAQSGAGGCEFFDIASSHNTRDAGSPEELASLARQLGKPLWNTELHGWCGPDEAAVTNTAKLFTQIRAGIGGFSDWLSLGNQKKTHKMFRAMADGSLEAMRIYYIYKELVNTSGGGRYLPVTLPAGITYGVAFLRDREMSIWLLNSGDQPVSDIAIKLGGRAIDTVEARRVWWGPDNGRVGDSATLSVVQGAATLRCDLPPMTLQCHTFKIR